MVKSERGTLFLVVGPSGAGKDTLLDAAREKLGSNPRYHFVRREITRPEDAGGEDHISVSAEEFTRRCADGYYALYWQANGHGYGVSSNIKAHLGAGCHVICNTSRTIVDSARIQFQPLRVIVVTAPLHVLAQRIADRGRESLTEVEARLQRAGNAMPQGPDVMLIENDGPVETAVERLTLALTEAVVHSAHE